MESEAGNKKKVEIISFLRRLLNDLEAGKVVRAALDLQALIRELERGNLSQSDQSSRSSQVGAGKVGVLED